MTTAVQRRRGTSTEHSTFTGLDGEITVNTTTYTLHIHDGATVGGVALAKADGSNLVTSSIDINGGTIDGTVIGGSSAAAITGTTITGTSFVSSGDMTFGDNDKAVFGAGSDLQIYHDGTRSYIQDSGNGDLRLRTNELRMVNADNTEVGIKAVEDGAVDLYYNGSEKLSTTNTGIDVTGTVTADGLSVDGNASLSAGNVTFTLFETDTTDLNTRFRQNGGALLVRTTSDDGATDTTRMSIDHTTGDLSLFEDTGTTAKFFWDASAESLGIGTASPAANLEVSSATGISPITPTAIRISSSSSGSGWDLNSPWGSLEFYSADTSGDGAGVKAQISSVMENSDTGAQAGLAFYTEFSTNGLTEKVRISTDGYLLVGKTASAIGTAGTEIYGTGVITSTRAGNILDLNRLSSDGNIAQFRKDGTTVGSIGSSPTTSQTYFAGTSRGVTFGSSTLYPCSNTGSGQDAQLDIGSGTYRFKNLYLSGGVYLGGTGAANHLDDYEEGTWTVTLYDALTGGNASSTTTTGYYTKVGNQVTVIFNGLNNISTTGMTAGNQLLISLPFSAALASSVGSIATDNITFAADGFSYMTSDVAVAASRASIHRVKDGSDGYLTVADVVDGVGDIGRFTLTYFTA